MSTLQIAPDDIPTPRRIASSIPYSPSSPELPSTAQNHPPHHTRTLSRSRTLPPVSPTSVANAIPTLDVSLDPEKLQRLRHWILGLAIGIYVRFLRAFIAHL